MDEAGKLDLNAARPETLERLLRIVGSSPPRAETLAAAVVAWRTPGPRPGVTGSGRRPFRFVEELLQVPGMAGSCSTAGPAATGTGGPSFSGA